MQTQDAGIGYYNLLLNPNGGNVGIGTTSPGYMLDVAGQVHADSFVSYTQTYADFVFKPGYKLASLSDVEASIKKDGHLPGIPSEAEAKEHGIDLASMQVKLLQKIEELTLHQIDEEKRNEQLEKEKRRASRKIEQMNSSLSKNSTGAGRVIPELRSSLGEGGPNALRPLLRLLAALAFLRVQAHAQTGIYVNPNGNVGIGTASPTRILDITSVLTQQLRIKSTGAGNHGLLIIDETGGGNAKVRDQI